MAITNFQQTLWNATVLRALRKTYVYGNLMSLGPYGGQITGGNTVKILSVSDISISTYTPGTAIADPSIGTDSAQSLTIDQMKYFNFQVDDVNAAQSINGGEILTELGITAANSMVDSTDQYIASLNTQITATTNQVGNDTTPSSITTSDLAYAHLTALRTCAQKANIPTQGRFLVVPPEFTALLLADSKNVAGYNLVQSGNYRSGFQPSAAGYFGTIAGWDLYESNNVPNTSGAKYKLIGGVKQSWAFAENIDKTEAYRPQSYFSDAVRGLHVYGAKIIRPTGMVLGTVSFS